MPNVSHSLLLDTVLLPAKPHESFYIVLCRDIALLFAHKCIHNPTVLPLTRHIRKILISPQPGELSTLCSSINPVLFVEQWEYSSSNVWQFVTYLYTALVTFIPLSHS